MKYLIYKDLPFHEQKNILWEHGVFVDTRVEGRNTINLYTLFDFFIELTYSLNSFQLLGITSYSNDNCLEKYLNSYLSDI